MVTAMEHYSLGWQTREQYAAFVRTGLRARPARLRGFRTLRGIREFKMTTWLMQNIGEGQEVSDEYARRISALRNDDAPRDWRPA
jgi:hypothetical protein